MKSRSTPRGCCIEIILSAEVQSRWKVTPSPKASVPPIHWLAQWRVEFGRRADCTTVVLVTNTTTLFTFVIPSKELARGQNFEQVFRFRLADAVAPATHLTAWLETPLVFVSGNPRMVVSSMNNIRQLLTWRSEGRKDGVEMDETWINDTPFSSLPLSFPREEFTSRLAER